MELKDCYTLLKVVEDGMDSNDDDYKHLCLRILYRHLAGVLGEEDLDHRDARLAEGWGEGEVQEEPEPEAEPEPEPEPAVEAEAVVPTYLGQPFGFDVLAPDRRNVPEEAIPLHNLASVRRICKGPVGDYLVGHYFNPFFKRYYWRFHEVNSVGKSAKNLRDIEQNWFYVPEIALVERTFFFRTNQQEEGVCHYAHYVRREDAHRIRDAAQV